MGVITLIFSSRKLSRRFLALGPMSALSDGDTRCSILERPRAWQKVRLYQKNYSPSSAMGVADAFWLIQPASVRTREFPQGMTVDPMYTRHFCVCQE
jgi:hypothetical protein